MAIQPLQDHNQEMPSPQGHAIGFVDTKPQCDTFTQALNTAGFPSRSIKVLSGDDGNILLKRMMSGSLWGESAEKILQQGIIEIENGHFMITVECEDHDEATIVGRLATQHGGRTFNYFGLLMDEQLTR